ncbi:alpha/beta fold hydrolase [Streptomyces sp. B1866]|uniref:thioesterase II family protein n=1 Tax=Streptomyces sp. B1866 TaxID=3075431 RepID=UPI00288F7AB7|nr:alpha/beta fold hydrolase [Streptomyces sp. B1866]MDT3397645.1 alpha/beta fold hydrolase [Streptomyces sp. B1866]
MTSWDRKAGPWLTRFTSPSAGDERIQLVCLPHSGGSSTFFAPLAREMPGSVEVLAVQYPGRQERRAEPFIDDMDELVARITDALGHAGDRPLALLGHSMGGLVAWEVARALQARGARLAGLVVSGRGAPTVHNIHNGVKLYELSDDQLVAQLRELSGTSASILADDGMIRMLLPALRNDYRVVDSYRHRPGPPLTCPIGVFLGTSDPWAREEYARGWREESTGRVEFRSFPGGHFYLSSQWRKVAEAVAETLVGVAAD